MHIDTKNPHIWYSYRVRNDELNELIHFILYLLQKFENDNLWLVDKLTDLGSENEKLKNKLDSEGTIREEFDTIFKKVCEREREGGRNWDV